jgi:hypothetical protein
MAECPCEQDSACRLVKLYLAEFLRCPVNVELVNIELDIVKELTLISLDPRWTDKVTSLWETLLRDKESMQQYQHESITGLSFIFNLTEDEAKLLRLSMKRRQINANKK